LGVAAPSCYGVRMNQYAKRRWQASGSGAAPSEETVPPVEPIDTTPPRVSRVPPEGTHRFDVAASSATVRLDRFLTDETGLSRTRVKGLIEAGNVTVDGVAQTDAGTKLRAGQTVALEMPPAMAAEPAGENIPLAVVFEDAHLIVIDKPAGLVVHPAAGHETGTLVNALIAHCGESLSGIGGVRRPGIVHRIDKDTSGLLVVAKTDVAHQGLAALFADHGRTLSLRREYVAFVWGAPGRGAGSVNAPIGRHPIHRERQAIVAAARGREAITHYEVEERFGAVAAPVAARLRCRLETGRTHQIRVHMAHLSHPLIGDGVYGAGFRTKVARLSAPARLAVEALGRQALHAATLGFAHPVTGEELLFESALPSELLALEAALSAA
jgi:23S rRNA pseudouridine1911/1915/1917 synthase